MVHLVWNGGTGVLQSILSSLILKVYHAFAFKPITIKFGKFTNFWMLFQMTCPIFNSIDIEYSCQEKICSYPVPCSFRTWPIQSILNVCTEEKICSYPVPCSFRTWLIGSGWLYMRLVLGKLPMLYKQI